MSEPKTNVPKFGSFRPKPPQQPAEAKPKDRDEEKRSSRSKPEKERKLGHHTRHRSRSRDRYQIPKASLVVSRVAPPDTTPDIFIIDRKGDVKNLVYGSIHRYSVPPYHRFGAGYVLGASLDLKIDGDIDDGKELTLRDITKSKSGRREKYIFARVEREKPRLLRLRPELVSEVEEDANSCTGFISLRTRGRKRKRGEENGENLGPDSEQESRDYRSIYGKAKSQDEPQDPDLQYATETDDSGSDAGRTIRFDTSIREKNATLSKKVDENPHDINAWLELIDHQDVLVNGGDDRRRITNAETRSTADIKIHMYEKALANTTCLTDRERLLQGLMAEGTKVWELKVQADRWEKIAKENIESLLLWTSYLNFKQSTFSTFRYEEIKELYLSRISLLQITIEKSGNLSVDSTNSLCQQILYVLLRATLSIRESGYSELSVAIWQGLLEFNFCGPTISLSKEEYVNLFRQFWESEVPRLGEDGALGWRRYIDDEDSSDVPEARTDEMHSSIQRTKIFSSWATAERQRSKCSRTPARTMDEVVEDDPFRVILFSDIEQFLISLPINMHPACIDAFFIFCRLPATTSIHEEPKGWSIDQFIRNDFIEGGLATTQQHFATKEQDDVAIPRLNPCFDVMYPNILPSSDSPFTARWQGLYGGDNGPVPYQFIQNALKQLTQASFTEDLAQYYMAFEYTNEPGTIKKIAKGLLKQHPSCFKLYNAYALMEWSRGNKEVANGVYSAALSMNESRLETESKPDSILLWKTLAWSCIEDGDKASSLSHLLSIPDGVPNSGVSPSPTAVLIAKQHIASTRDFLLSTGDPEHAVLYTECLTLLAYLTETSGKEPKSASQGDISIALETIVLFSEALATRKYKHHQEVLLQSAARLLIHHCNNGPYRPSLVRTQLTNFLTLFPRNTLFLSIYTSNEARLRVDNRVRSLFLSTILIPENDCLTSRLFAIQYEIQFGTIHSVKSAFEKAVASPISRFSPGLWKLYLLWVAQNEKQLSKHGKTKGLAKDIWYRALRACPWTKELYVVGFEILGEKSGKELGELRSTWRVMGEKELRVHVDLEDEFEDIEESERAKTIGDS